MTTRHKRGRREPWGEFEDLALKEFYPRHGPSWDGWHEVLAGRTTHAISVRAHKMGLKAPQFERKKHVADVFDEEVGRVPLPKEYEKTVDKMMSEGKTPTQIDRQMHWIPGTTAGILRERWASSNE